MKFSEMPYQRPNLDEIKAQFAAVTQRFAAAPDYAAAKAAFLDEQTLNKHVDTLANLASIRNTMHVTDCALAGADIATVPYGVLTQMLRHPLTDAGILKFQADSGLL